MEVTAAVPIYKDRTFYAPRFEIRLQGQKLGRAVIRDVLEVTYTDSMKELDSFEFTLNDWDPVLREPRYSSPYDDRGQLKKLEDGSDVPNFDPGAKVELYLGYYPDELLLVMTGTVVSISPSFPSSGTPQLKIRALNPLYTLQRKQETMTFENKSDSEIAQQIGQKLEIAVEIPPGQESQETKHPYILLENEYPINFLMSRALRLGCDLYIKQPEEGDPVLFFGKTTTNSVTYELTWGRTLVEFTPTVKTKGQVTKVVVRGWLPGKESDDRKVEEVAQISDVSLNLPDPKLAEAIDAALKENHDEVANDPIESREEARQKAIGLLEDKLKELVTGRGSTVGLPDLRAGRTVVIKGIGFRYNGRYLVTETTHTIGGGGYTTQFSARLEGPP